MDGWSLQASGNPGLSTMTKTPPGCNLNCLRRFQELSQGYGWLELTNLSTMTKTPLGCNLNCLRRFQESSERYGWMELPSLWQSLRHDKTADNIN